ncbi:MAG: hypothetical protein V3U17_00440 [Thermoplasmata archaeon]
MSVEENIRNAKAADEAGSGQEDLSEKKAAENWFARHVEGEAKKDSLPLSERAGSVVGFIVILLVTLFWVVHQTSSTGFFTSGFGPAEAFLFYLSLLFGLVPTAARIVVGRKNVVRPLDMLNMVLIVVAILWLLWVFPFDFSHLADVLPESLRFLLQWISDDVAKVVMTIAIIATSIRIIYTSVLYVSVRRELSKPQP